MFQETGHTILDIVIGLLSGAFGFDASTTPDLSNWIVFKADRQYSRKGPWRRHLLNAQADMIAQVAEAKEKAEKAAKGKRKRKRKKAKNNKK